MAHTHQADDNEAHIANEATYKYLTDPGDARLSSLGQIERPYLLTTLNELNSHLLASGEVDRQLHETKGPSIQISDLRMAGAKLLSGAPKRQLW